MSCHQNLITSSVHHTTYLDKVTSISDQYGNFSDFVQKKDGHVYRTITIPASVSTPGTQVNKNTTLTVQMLQDTKDYINLVILLNKIKQEAQLLQR